MAKKREMTEIAVGEVITLLDGTDMEVVSNSRDGVWILCRRAGTEEPPEPVFWTDVIASESP